MIGSISTTSNVEFDLVKMAILKRYANEFREANKERYKTTSPYALTTKLPQLRIVDNAIQTGKGDPIHVSTSSHAIRGFFGGVKGVVNNTSGGGGGWKLDTKVQFDKVYMCPVTNREFTDDDMETYKDHLHQECRMFAENKLTGNKLEILLSPGTLDITIRLGDNIETFTYENFMKFIRRS